MAGKARKVLACVALAPLMEKVFEDMDRIRKRAKPLRGVTIKDLIEEGRM